MKERDSNSLHILTDRNMPNKNMPYSSSSNYHCSRISSIMIFFSSRWDISIFFCFLFVLKEKFHGLRK